MPNFLTDPGNEANSTLTIFRFRVSVMLSLCCFNKMLISMKLFALI